MIRRQIALLLALWALCGLAVAVPRGTVQWTHYTWTDAKGHGYVYRFTLTGQEYRAVRYRRLEDISEKQYIETGTLSEEEASRLAHRLDGFSAHLPSGGSKAAELFELQFGNDERSFYGTPTALRSQVILFVNASTIGLAERRLKTKMNHSQ